MLNLFSRLLISDSTGFNKPDKIVYIKKQKYLIKLQYLQHFIVNCFRYIYI